MDQSHSRFPHLPLKEFKDPMKMKILAVLENFETDEILFAESEAQKNTLWSLRRKVGEAVKSQSIYKEEDTVVPRFALPQLLFHVKEIGKKYGFHSVCYGHAGDGNLHVNIIKGELSDEQWENELPIAIREIFTEVVKLGGTLSEAYAFDNGGRFGEPVVI
jgi:glycolate oxidase